MQGKRLLAALCFTIAAGCGPGLGTPHTVTGKITYQNEPLSHATINFAAQEGIPAEHRFKSATTGADGTYKIENVYPAEYQVAVIPAEASVEPTEDPGAMPAEPTGGKHPLMKYANDSPLRAKVEDGKTNFDFNLDS